MIVSVGTGRPGSARSTASSRRTCGDSATLPSGPMTRTPPNTSSRTVIARDSDLVPPRRAAASAHAAATLRRPGQSLSMISPVAVPSAMAPGPEVTPVRTTENDSSGSATRSPTTATVMVAVVVPLATVTVPVLVT